MIKYIEIKNFRCFNKTKAKGFTKINLIGGKNNSGKTALLEALLLMGEPSLENIIHLLRFRNIDLDFVQALPQKGWDSFFFLEEDTIDTSLFFGATDNKIRETILKRTKDYNYDLLIEDLESTTKDEHFINHITDILPDDAKLTSILSVKASEQDKEIVDHELIASKKGIVTKREKAGYNFFNTHFIPTGLKLKSSELAQRYDKAQLQGNDISLLEAFKIIDNTIEDIESFNIGHHALYVKRKGQKFMPLSLYGDAMNKVANIILSIIGNESNIILIDEIENGIHHENQETFWKMLFDLANKYNVQVFATSHSAEMIEAFKNVVLQHNLEAEGTYFELLRHPKTNEIIMQKLSAPVLENKINHNRPMRGE